MDFILTPPVAFIIYLPAVYLIVLLGKKLAGKPKASELKSSLYGSGEEAPTDFASPGYKPFFLVALFFAVLHLGILVMGSGNLRPVEAVFLGGLIFALLALILG